MTWLPKSFMVMLLFVPSTLTYSFVGKTFGIKGELVISAWLVGSAIGTTAISFWLGNANHQDLNNWIPLLGVSVAAAILVAFPNMLFAQTVSEAISVGINPALPMAIMGATTVPAYLFAALLANFLPKYFPPTSFNLLNVVGLIMVCIGIGLITYRPTPIE